MNNKVNLTDDELSLIMTSLMMTISAHNKYVEQNGSSGLDLATGEAIEGIKELYNRFNKGYF